MKCVRYLMFSFIALFAGSLWAAPTITAHQMVENTTQQVLSIIEGARSYIDDDPQRFYGEIEVVLSTAVDFNGFARGVMGKYASKRYYKTLKTDEDKAQFKARVMRFSETFRDGLVQTYAKGLLAFNGNKVAVLPPEDNAVSTKKGVTVIQHIQGDREEPYVVRYKVRQNKAGEWKLRNVTIEAINLGKVYQSQFYSAAKQYEGDIDRVIDSWSVDPAASSDSELTANES